MKNPRKGSKKPFSERPHYIKEEIEKAIKKAPSFDDLTEEYSEFETGIRIMGDLATSFSIAKSIVTSFKKLGVKYRIGAMKLERDKKNRIGDWLPDKVRIYIHF